MCWKNLQDRASELGLSVEYRICAEPQRGMVPDMAETKGSGWMLVGNYDHVAGIWAKPVTEAARRLSPRHVAEMLADCDVFVETVGDYDADYFAAAAPFRAAMNHPEWGCMLA
ncbi:MAG: hypothetical protein M0P39_12175 [Rhodocyclaceae bacterium]|nr:hypothetical protein [Rhodocyclaceae bacterium]